MLSFFSCLKKYCVCFAAKRACTDHCRCQGCQNDGSDVLANKQQYPLGSQNILCSPRHYVPQAPIPAFTTSFPLFDLDQTVQLLATHTHPDAQTTVPEGGYEEKDTSDIVAV